MTSYALVAAAGLSQLKQTPISGAVEDSNRDVVLLRDKKRNDSAADNDDGFDGRPMNSADSSLLENAEVDIKTDSSKSNDVKTVDDDIDPSLQTSTTNDDKIGDAIIQPTSADSSVAHGSANKKPPKCPVVFMDNTGEMAQTLSPAIDIGISFGFDDTDVVSPSYVGTCVHCAEHQQSSSPATAAVAPSFADCATSPIESSTGCSVTVPTVAIGTSWPILYTCSRPIMPLLTAHAGGRAPIGVVPPIPHVIQQQPAVAKISAVDSVSQKVVGIHSAGRIFVVLWRCRMHLHCA
jgi:hypothetical protein